MLALAAPFALPVDWSILDVTLGVVAHQVVVHKRKIVGLFVEPHQGATDLGRVRVDQLGKVADAEAVRSDLVPIDVPLLRFLMLQVPLAQQVPHHVRRGIIHPVEPLHTDALTGVPETLRIVAIVMGKLATFCVEFGQMCEFVVPAQFLH